MEDSYLKSDSSGTSEQTCPINAGKPKWFENLQKESFSLAVKEPDKTEWNQNENLDLEKRCNSGRRSGQSRHQKSPLPPFIPEELIMLNAVDSNTHNELNIGELSQSSQSLSRYASRDQHDNLQFLDLEAFPSRENSAKHGRRALSAGCTQGSKSLLVDKVQNAVIVDETLEESWKSLHVFDRSHKGRLTTDLHEPKVQLSTTQENCESLPMGDLHHNDADSKLKSQDKDLGFVIPELPEGQEMKICITSTWGDKHYVGLNGIEFFSHTGESVNVQKITADPLDINVLPEYTKDPRIITNLIDGVYRTRDDMHLWLAPFTPGSCHYIFVTFERKTKIALVRIWNYNKSRIHSYRGVKDVDIFLDGVLIFRGEILRASGEMQGSTDTFGDTILFTTDDEILEKILKHDDNFVTCGSDKILSELDMTKSERPGTGNFKTNEERPHTCALSSKNEQYCDVEHTFLVECLEITLVANWGDKMSIGLTGMEIVRENEEIVSLNETEMTLCSNTHRICDSERLIRLIDGVNITMDEEHMWSCDYVDIEMLTLCVHFTQPQNITSLRIWNFNKSTEDTYKGVKLITVQLDGRMISPRGGYLVRKAPGNCHFDYAQEIKLIGPPLWTQSLPFTSNKCGSESIVELSRVTMPRGFVFQLQLFSTWGDMYYIGLNAIEMYDAVGQKITLTANNIAAYPDSVNVLEGISNDVRTPEKLVDGYNDSRDGHHMWLAPVLPNIVE